MNFYDYKQPLLAQVFLDDNLITVQHLTDSNDRQLSLTCIISDINNNFGADNWNRIVFSKEVA